MVHGGGTECRATGWCEGIGRGGHGQHPPSAVCGRGAKCAVLPAACAAPCSHACPPLPPAPPHGERLPRRMAVGCHEGSWCGDHSPCEGEGMWGMAAGCRKGSGQGGCGQRPLNAAHNCRVGRVPRARSLCSTQQPSTAPHLSPHWKLAVGSRTCRGGGARRWMWVWVWRVAGWVHGMWLDGRVCVARGCMSEVWWGCMGPDTEEGGGVVCGGMWNSGSAALCPCHLPVIPDGYFASSSK